ncbi:hypothetical protein TNCV_4128941 [Trichonephila clavipes]|nr:hypothetical protein TNCV_4128941 [Trichonephila clavipes]
MEPIFRSCQFSNLTYSVGNEYRPLFSTNYPRKNCRRIGPKVSLDIGNFQGMLHRTKSLAPMVAAINSRRGIVIVFMGVIRDLA